MDKKMDKELKNIKLFICDVDGILTDGQFIKDTAGEEVSMY
jgi:3-deoxy-D-manno-octulosonate 8-phosphate phosphatase (KDO 8-P phosphatase)